VQRRCQAASFDNCLDLKGIPGWDGEARWGAPYRWIEQAVRNRPGGWDYRSSQTFRRGAMWSSGATDIGERSRPRTHGLTRSRLVYQ